VVTPQRYSTELSTDILGDESVLVKISEYVNAQRVGYLQPWGATPQIYSLVDEFKTRNIRIISEELPDRNAYWSCNYIDSKIGFRELCVKLQRLCPNIQIPRSFICDSFASAMEILKWFHMNKIPCVLKSSSGIGGYGNVFLWSEMLMQPFQEVEMYVLETIKALPYFKSGAAIIEELIPTSETFRTSTHQGCSNSIFMSGLILPNGKMKIVGGGTDMRDSQCLYIGAEIGKYNPLDDFIFFIKPAMYQIGETIAEYGYRGHWGVNFMISREGIPIAIELNARRCGESHAYALAERIYGEDWMSSCSAITRFPFQVQIECDVTTSSILRAFEKTNTSWKRKGVWTIPTQVSWLQQPNPGIGYVVLGTDKDIVKSVEQELQENLAEEGIKSREY